MVKGAWLLAAFLGVSLAGCGAKLIRPRAAGEKFEDRPDRALVVGQFDVTLEGFDKKQDDTVRMTRHRLVVGDDDVLFTDEVPSKGRTFAIWMVPGVFCFGRPTVGGGDSPKVLGKGAPCAEIQDAGTAYYVGSVTWHVKKSGEQVSASLDVKNQRESVMAARNLAGVYPENALVSLDLDVKKVASKYKVP